MLPKIQERKCSSVIVNRILQRIIIVKQHFKNNNSQSTKYGQNSDLTIKCEEINLNGFRSTHNIEANLESVTVSQVILIQQSGQELNIKDSKGSIYE